MENCTLSQSITLFWTVAQKLHTITAVHCTFLNSCTMRYICHFHSTPNWYRTPMSMKSNRINMFLVSMTWCGRGDNPWWYFQRTLKDQSVKSNQIKGGTGRPFRFSYLEQTVLITRMSGFSIRCAYTQFTYSLMSYFVSIIIGITISKNHSNCTYC